MNLDEIKPLEIPLSQIKNKTDFARKRYGLSKEEKDKRKEYYEANKDKLKAYYEANKKLSRSEKRRRIEEKYAER